MESLLLSLNVTLPIFLMMAAGYLLRHLKLMDDEFIKKVNQLNFRVFLPLSTFNNLYCADIAALWNGKVLLFAFFSIVIIFIVSMFAVRALTKEHAQRATMVSILFRSNYSYVGLPVAAAICGTANATVSTLVLAIAVPLYNILATIGFEYYRGGRLRMTELLLKIVKNPCVIASVLGIIFMFSGIGKFPSYLANPLGSLAAVCTPMALISLGGSLEFKNILGNKKLLVWGNLIRLILIPGIFVTLSILLGFRDSALAALFALFATPPAMITFAVSQIMGGDSKLAAQQIVSQSTLSILTMFIWVFVIHSLGFF